VPGDTTGPRDRIRYGLLHLIGLRLGGEGGADACGAGSLDEDAVGDAEVRQTGFRVVVMLQVGDHLPEPTYEPVRRERRGVELAAGLSAGGVRRHESLSEGPALYLLPAAEKRLEPAVHRNRMPLLLLDGP
jgi:hypothetical protein